MALTVKTQRRLGALPDLPDHRDYLFKSVRSTVDLETAPLRHEVKGFTKKVPLMDQLTIGSCTGQAVGAMFMFVRDVSMRSRLQLYYEGRRLIGMENEDSGAYIRDVVKVASQLGAGREVWWPYDITKFTVDPPLKVDRDALLRRIMTYYRLETREDFRKCLLENHPFVGGFSVYDMMMHPRTEQFGILPLPQAHERNRGGHAVTFYAYDDDFKNSDWAKNAVANGFPIHLVPDRVYIFRNSWGDWGHNGDCAIDANYIENRRLASDFWTMRRYEVKRAA